MLYVSSKTVQHVFQHGIKHRKAAHENVGLLEERGLQRSSGRVWSSFIIIEYSATLENLLKLGPESYQIMEWR